MSCLRHDHGQDGVPIVWVVFKPQCEALLESNMSRPAKPLLLPVVRSCTRCESMVNLLLGSLRAACCTTPLSDSFDTVKPHGMIISLSSDGPLSTLSDVQAVRNRLPVAAGVLREHYTNNKNCRMFRA